MEQPLPLLAEPFSQIFVDRAEAEWAFDLLRDTAKRLGIQGAYDPRFALTLARRSGRPGLHLNFGGWLVIGFHGPGLTPARVDLTLLAQAVNWDERFSFASFAPKESEPEVRSYHLPLEMIRPMTSDLAAAYEATLDFIARKFHSWKRAIHWQRHNPEIAEALFKPEQRERIFAGLLTEPELRYERHLTAFYQDVSEEREEYEMAEAEMRGGEEAEEMVDLGEDFDVENSLQRRSGVNLKDSSKLIEEKGYFTSKTFELLEALHVTPTKEFYLSHKDEFRIYVEEPLQQLFGQVARQLPVSITNLMETDKKIFAQILKNDYGQGGAWDFYWGAFYRKGGKRTENAQLFISIHPDCLEFGFYVGVYGSIERKQFLHNVQLNYGSLLSLLQQVLADDNIVYGSRENYVLGRPTPSFEDWLKDVGEADIRAAVILHRDQIVKYSTENLVKEIIHSFVKFFSLILLAVVDDPLSAISQHLGLTATDKEFAIENPPSSSFILHPSSSPYPLPQLAADTGLDETELARWVRAIERKGQAILYGPPGTGKTFIAEKLAKHLIGGRDGFWELAALHPAYAYEDFIQGIRPESQGDHLTYPIKPGRFLEFCEKAKNRQNTCVLIIDEINRANLSRVFGELMYLLEYRDRSIPLAGGGNFHIPANVRLIGTMNTADRSIALVDHALRRRFAFIALQPNYELLRHYHQQTGLPVEGLIETLTRLNRTIGDPHYEVGITYFLRLNLAAELEDIWRMEIEPYLEEYFFDRPEQVDNFRWEKVKTRILSLE